MKNILVEKHPTEPHTWLLVNSLGGEWEEIFGDDKKRLLAVLDLLPPTKQFGIYHVYELSNDEFYSVLGRLP